VCRSVRLAAYCSQQPLEVLTARAARAQVGRDARVPLFRFRRAARGHQLSVNIEHFHRPGAAHIARIGPQETIQLIPAGQERLEVSRATWAS
jgi:hypothetical protein